MEKHNCGNWRITIEGVVNDLKETVKIQATRLELLEETVTELSDRLGKLEAKQQFPSRHCNFGIPVVRLVRLRGLPADNQRGTSEDAETVVPTNETREGQETECICSNEEVELIPDTLATAEKRKVSEAEGSETLDLEEGIDDKKKYNTRAAEPEPGRISVSGTSPKPSKTDHRASVRNKKCPTTQLSNTPERKISTMSNSGPGKKKSSAVERPKCTLCLKTFVTVHILRRHMRTHNGEKPFECNVCQKSFSQSKNLTAHARTHTSERSFKCEVCHKSFNVKFNFVRHQRVHTGEKPFTCNFCNQTFRQKINLENHIRIHTGERPYKCEVCDADFNRSVSLYEHKEKHT